MFKRLVGNRSTTRQRTDLERWSYYSAEPSERAVIPRQGMPIFTGNPFPSAPSAPIDRRRIRTGGYSTQDSVPKEKKGNQMSSSCSSAWSWSKYPYASRALNRSSTTSPNSSRLTPCRPSAARSAPRLTTSWHPRAYPSRSEASALVCERSVTVGTPTIRAAFTFAFGSRGRLGRKNCGCESGSR